MGALVLIGVAIAIAWFGLRINAWYGWALGKTPEASSLLAGLSVAADALALCLPAVGRTLWLDRRYAIACAAWSIWSITMAVALLATVGFAATNIADTTAVRAKVANENAGLAERIGRLRTERAGITEPRSVEAIEAEIQRAQPGALPVWKATAGCRDVTRPESGQACDASRFEMKRINHEEAYSQDGACANWAEEFFSRMRRAEIGHHHHHISGAYLLRYAQEASWREDNRRVSNGEQVQAVAGHAMKRGRSVDFCGHWQRHLEGKRP